jgi:uncharacterized protein YecE (DUF72 family)
VTSPTLFVGTSGYAYKEWKGSFYPEKLPAKDMLAYYGERFPAVEINNTFYRMPSESVLLGWRSAVPDQFQFVLKASRRITHFKRLKDVGEELGYVLKTSTVLQNQLGPTLFQLPPNLPKDAERLATFLELLPVRWRAAVEFRHESWFEPEVYQILADHQVALVSAETEEQEEVPFAATTTWGYLRLRKPEYGDGELRAWESRIKAQAWDRVYVFFKHEDEATGPRLANRFRQVFEGEPAASQ